MEMVLAFKKHPAVCLALTKLNTVMRSDGPLDDKAFIDNVYLLFGKLFSPVTWFSSDRNPKMSEKTLSETVLRSARPLEEISLFESLQT